MTARTDGNKRRRLVVGLTGGIACGKSTAADCFAACGAKVLCADSMAREELEPGRAGFRAVLKRFGRGVLAADGHLDRAAVAGKIFSSEKERKWLEGMVHPRVIAGMRREISRSRGVVVLDVPLLFETRMEVLCDVTLAVVADGRARLARAKTRGWTAAELKARERAQLSPERKAALADIAIDNSGNRQTLLRAVRGAYRAFAALAK